MDKQTPNVKKLIFKTLILFLLAAFFMLDYVEIFPVSENILRLYVSMMFVCLISFMLTFFKKLRKCAYFIFISGFAVYVYMYNNVTEIIEKHRQEYCLEVGKIYDPVQKICRDDCWTWDDKSGCLKE